MSATSSPSATSTNCTWKKKAHRFKIGPQAFNDYRKMLDEMADKIDAVTVSTPDHSHAPAERHGHADGQALLHPEAADLVGLRSPPDARGRQRDEGRHADGQPGDRRRRLPHRRSRSFDPGAIGPVKEVHVWTNRPIWPQGDGRPNGTDPIPKPRALGLVPGPAPERPYVTDVYHPFKWRGWLDFGTGALGDMACHTVNMAVHVAGTVRSDPVEVKRPRESSRTRAIRSTRCSSTTSRNARPSCSSTASSCRPAR